jgi:hypothetical protein
MAIALLEVGYYRVASVSCSPRILNTKPALEGGVVLSIFSKALFRVLSSVTNI